jgi:hypothetical protein
MSHSTGSTGDWRVLPGQGSDQEARSNINKQIANQAMDMHSVTQRSIETSLTDSAASGQPIGRSFDMSKTEQ